MASAKLASLFIRTLSKPLATYFKTQAKERPGFRNICISVAQTYHVIEMKLSMRFLDYKKETIRPLNETKAVELGANFLSEVFVFSVAVGCILAEAWRSNRAANRKVKTIKGDLESVGELGKETEVIVKRLEQECENLKIQHQVLINENKEILQGLEKIYRFMELESMLPREDRKSS